MKPFLIFLIIATVLLFVCGIPPFFKAGAVEHHGLVVEDAGLHGGSYTVCLICHCDVIAQEPPPCMPVCAIGRSHPLNSIYPPLNKKEGFRTVEDAEQHGVKFVAGKTDCISCHDLMKKDRKKHLRFENRQQLCEACHTKL